MAGPATINSTAFAPGGNAEKLGHTRLLKEWAATQPWDAEPIRELRLGPTTQSAPGVTLTPAVEAMLRVANWYADLVGPRAGQLWVVEAKLQPDPGAIGQVLFYSRLIMSTPALKPLWGLPIRPVVLFGCDDRDVRNFAQSLGVIVEVFTPSWYEAYCITRRFRRRMESQP